MNNCPLGKINKGIAGPKYRVLGQIGQGQFGQVFCGIHRQTGQVVALKQLDTRRLTTPRFLHELNLLASLQHPNIVAFHTLEYSESGRYLIMDYCEGGTLRQLIDAPEPLTLRQSLQLIIDILQGLAHAHQRGVVHCDLKPENVLLTLTAIGWTAHLSDFGVARLLTEPDSETRRGDTGSPAYMAPERFYSTYSPASDLYAAGVLLYELVVGQRPFSGTPGDLMTAHLNQPLEIPATVPTCVGNIIQQATQKLPQHRFSSAEAMLKSLCLAVAAAEEHPVALPVLDLPVLDREVLTSPILTLATDAERLYLGLESAIDCRSVKQVGLGATIQTYSVPQSQGMQIWTCRRGLFVRTQRATAHTLSWLPTASENKDSQDISVRTLGSWQSELLEIMIDPEGTWMGIATEVGLCQLLQLPTLKPLGAVHGSLTSVLALDSRHGVAVIADERGVRLRLLNRRGHLFDYCRLPTQIYQIIQSLRHPYRVLALSTATGFLVTFNPLQIKHIALPIAPTFWVATLWGYLLADQAGGVALIDEAGNLVGHLTLPLGDLEVVRAIATHQSQLIAATWSGQQGMLYSFDLKPFINQAKSTRA
jgi:serine/threonine protein kinase